MAEGSFMHCTILTVLLERFDSYRKIVLSFGLLAHSGCIFSWFKTVRSQSAFTSRAYNRRYNTWYSSRCRGNRRNSHLLWPFVLCKQFQTSHTRGVGTGRSWSRICPWITQYYWKETDGEVGAHCTECVWPASVPPTFTQAPLPHLHTHMHTYTHLQAHIFTTTSLTIYITCFLFKGKPREDSKFSISVVCSNTTLISKAAWHPDRDTHPWARVIQATDERGEVQGPKYLLTQYLHLQLYMLVNLALNEVKPISGSEYADICVSM